MKASLVSQRTSNPIRNIVDKLNVEPNPEKELISLAIGDPTVFGNFQPPPQMAAALMKCVTDQKHNGYAPASGYAFAKEAVSKQYGLAPNDVILTSGCSGALDLCFGVLCNEGDNILLPSPGFSLYTTLADNKNLKIKYYNLLPQKGWQVDIDQLASLIDSKTRAIVLNNPSNPCGSVYDEQHLLDLMKLSQAKNVPIVADEIYGDMVFEGNSYISLSEVARKNNLKFPLLSVGGLAKRYMIPGYRVGWVLIYDDTGAFEEIRKGLQALSQVILGCNTLIQGIIPSLLQDTPSSYHEANLKQLHENVKLCLSEIGKIEGLTPIQPQGAMYLMVGIDIVRFKNINDDVQFSEQLLKEENVLVLPGQCFQYKNFVRLVIAPPKDKLQAALARLAKFCSRALIK